MINYASTYFIDYKIVKSKKRQAERWLCLSIACSALSLARSAQAEREDKKETW